MKESKHQNIGSFSCAILGMGKAGFALANSLSLYDVTLDASCSRSNPGYPTKCFTKLPEFLSYLSHCRTKILFIAIPDDKLSSMAQKLASIENLPQIVAYLSGSHKLEILRPIEKKTSTAMFHPLSVLEKSSHVPQGTLTAICSRDEKTSNVLTELATYLDLNPTSIKNGKQSIYHAAACISANLSFGLLSYSAKLMKRAGISERKARVALAHLLKSTAQAAASNPLPKALTGPAARGDLGTIRKHMEVLEDFGDPNLTKIYSLLSEELFEITASKR